MVSMRAAGDERGRDVVLPVNSSALRRVRRSRSGVNITADGNRQQEAEMAEKEYDWSKPAAIAIPKGGYFGEPERGRYGPIFPKTPANYGFTVFAKIKEGREEAVRAYGKTLEDLIKTKPDALELLELHYLRWQLIPVGDDLYFQYQGIFDTDFDKYTEDAVSLFSKYGVNT